MPVTPPRARITRLQLDELREISEFFTRLRDNYNSPTATSKADFALKAYKQAAHVFHNQTDKT